MTWLPKAAAEAYLTIWKAVIAAKMESRTQESFLAAAASLLSGQNGLLVMRHSEEASRNEFASGESSKLLINNSCGFSGQLIVRFNFAKNG